MGHLWSAQKPGNEDGMQNVKILGVLQSWSLAILRNHPLSKKMRMVTKTPNDPSKVTHKVMDLPNWQKRFKLNLHPSFHVHHFTRLGM